MRSSDEIGELVAALALANLEFDNILAAHEANAGRKKYNYANIADVVRHVRPIIARHGLAIAQGEHLDAQKDGYFVCVTKLMHKSGQWLETDFEVPIDKMGGVHGIGSSNSYARRYAELAILNLAVEDDDGQTAQRQWQQRQQQRPAPEPTLDDKLKQDAFRRTWHEKLSMLEVEFADEAEQAAVHRTLFGYADLADIPPAHCAAKRRKLLDVTDQKLYALIQEARLKHTLGAVKTGEVHNGQG